MERSYRYRLLREAMQAPKRLPLQRKFWRRDFWTAYLQRCYDLLEEDPQHALELTKPAPALAARIARRFEDVEHCDLLMTGHALLGTAYRACGDYESAGRCFERAGSYERCATSDAIAEYLRRYSHYKSHQLDPEGLALANRAVQLRKRGNLVNRHELGRCLLCRGHAYVVHQNYNAALDDWTAALNHLSFGEDRVVYLAAVHNILTVVVEYGDEESLHLAGQNLKPALTRLHVYHDNSLAKLKLRWILAILDARTGRYGSAEETFLTLMEKFADRGLAFEIGMLAADLAELYLRSGRPDRLTQLVHDTVALFRRLGLEARAQETLDIVRQSRQAEVAFRKLRTAFARGVLPAGPAGGA